MKRTISIVCLFALYAVSAEAQVSSTISLSNDYMFNGVTQTDEKPAFQASLDWSSDSGFYVGTWGSNVDFGDDTNLELDVYGGYSFAHSENLSFDFGFAHYTYHGGDDSSDGDYTELYIKSAFNNSEFNVWYTDDYAGTSAAHIIMMANHSWYPADNLSVTVGADYSKSLDDRKFTWDGDRDAYIHWHLTGDWSFENFDLSAAIHGTDLKDSSGDTRVLVSVSKTFSF